MLLSFDRAALSLSIEEVGTNKILEVEELMETLVSMHEVLLSEPVGQQK